MPEPIHEQQPNNVRTEENLAKRDEIELSSVPAPSGSRNGYQTIFSQNHHEKNQEDLLENGEMRESDLEEKKGEVTIHHQQQVIAFDANCEDCEETV